MGLKLRMNLFRGVTAADIHAAFEAFHAARGKRLLGRGDDFRAFRLHARQGEWTTLWLDGGWEWEVRRQAQLAVSRALRCAGLLVFVDDGDYWGYELFDSGEVLDQFVQEDPEDGQEGWFPGKSLTGNAGLLARCLRARLEDVEPHLIQDPVSSGGAWRIDADDLEALSARGSARARLDVPARPGDEFTRFAECSVLDFLRMLGVDVALRSGCVRLAAPEFRRFWVEE